ncbi:AIPR family protein [Lysobacter sp. A286]
MNPLLTDPLGGLILDPITRGGVLTAMPLDLSYPAILELFGTHLIPGRVESRALLGWFLENYYRLDETDAQDAICDGPDDKGIDGIYVDSNLERIIVFQTKLRQNIDRTLGDADLKSFAGTLDQLRSRESIEHLQGSTKNVELAQLIKDANLAERVEKDYEVRGVFITNVNKDDSAVKYLKMRPDIAVVDGDELDTNWVAPGDAEPVHTAMTFRLEGLSSIEYRTPEATAYVAPLLATELVAMSGLQSGELFAWNVRQTLGKTKVNKAIAESVKEQGEHKNFLLYHNGLTILAEEAELTEDSITINGYTVVNGCQSLTTLFEHRAGITDELRLLTRIIKLPPGSQLAAKITRHSNNQNSISARDLQSNSNIQRRLQAEFREVFPGEFGYEIKRGEVIGASHSITNEAAGKQLLAFDLHQPWACHQTYRLFDELHSEIFARKEVNAMRVATLSVLFEAVLQTLPELKNRLVASYTLTRFFMLYLLRQALDVDPGGREFVRDPSPVVDKFGFDAVSEIAQKILSDLIIDMNAELEDREQAGTPFDYKRELKSPTAVKALAKQIIPSYEKAIRRNRATSFSSELEALVAE